MKRLWQVAAIVATAVALGAGAFATWYWVGGLPERHLDGQGPLDSFRTTGTSISMGFAPIGGPIWTVGIPICLGWPNDPAVLDGSVSGTTVVGDDWRYLGARVREFNPNGDHTPIQSVSGFPPILPDPLQQEKGFEVKQPCDFAHPGPTTPYTELLIGVGAWAGTGGGGWKGVDIGYNTHGRHHVLSTAWNFFACGPLVPAQYCGSPSPSPSPT